MSCKELIRKAIYFSGAYTSEVCKRIWEQGGQAGIHSIDRRLQEGNGIDWIGTEVPGHKEKFWELIKRDKTGQGSFL